MSYKSGFVSIVGRPNVGKSTLLNSLLGEKIAAVSPKPQTTRTKIMGVVTDDEAQVVFLDTPGIHKPKNKLGKLMVRSAEQSAGEADVVLYMLDASDYSLEKDGEILEGISAPAVFLLINKTDKVEKPDLLPLIEAFSRLRAFDEIIPVSAMKKEGLGELMNAVKKRLPSGPQFFPEDTLTDQPEKQIAAEFIREKMMRNLSEEIPYGTAVVIEKMKYDDAKDMTVIAATIYCEREGHKAIVIGKGGTMLKKIGTDARRDIARFTGTKVFLELWVKVRENWRNSDAQLKNFGYSE